MKFHNLKLRDGKNINRNDVKKLYSLILILHLELITLTNRVQTKAGNTSLPLVVGSLLFCYAIERRFWGRHIKPSLHHFIARKAA